ncbi:SurA N-terminal domain-containing protein [Kineobactrum salinum]|uniref:Periplasmic chaperone PpiD n=1 Tax=Kineobactrum salinum TaxID=2708301 RepID=A0A6C0U6C9_9GAMM|nr:SurA N-terminal domain-containing protein [Kineobactrum salinum]QIB67423.1 peptidylprolyl isomerase [Kineobactrum salinum]
MLQDLRKSTQGTAAKVIIAVIVLSFALFGLESILVSGGRDTVAEVNGEAISPAELQQAVDTQRRQLISMLGEDLDPAMLDEQRLSARALEGIINRKVLLQSAVELDLVVSEQELGKVIAGMEQFQMDGQFSPEMYKSLLASAGYTPASFKRALRDDLLVNQLRSGLAGSDFATPAELELNARILGEQRDIRYLTIPFAPFLEDAGGDIEQADIEAYYRANEERFRTPETVELNYLELTLDDFREAVDENAIEEEYQLEISNYQYQSENRVSHILLQQRSDESGDEFEARVNEVQQALAGGQDFAEVAAAMSDDVGSASNGGDLGFTAGDAFPEAMEEAIGALEVNEISGPVVTEAGTHILQVTERREADPPSLDELRPELERRLQEREARVALLLAVEELRDLAFNADNLQRPASELGLEVKRSEPISRDQDTGPLASPKVIRAAFSEDVLELGHNSEVLELDSNRFVAVHVHRHNPPALQSLDLVRDEIVAALTEQQAREQLQSAAEEAVAAVESGESVESVAKRLDYEWQVELGAQRSNRMVPQPVLQRAFRLPEPTTEPLVDYVIDDQGNGLVLQLLRAKPGTLASYPAEEQRELRQRVSSEFGALLQVEHQQGLRAEADISIRN